MTLNTQAASKCHDAALVYSAQGQLKHDIPNNFACRTEDANTAGGFSNIALGSHGVGAVDAFINDNGGGNTAVGHRRWKLSPMLQQIATGDVGKAVACPGCKANAIAVTCPGCLGNRATTPGSIVTWPSAVHSFQAGI